MEIVFSSQFKKRFEKIPAKVQNQFEKRIELFLENPNHPSLKVHPLKGNLLGFRAFSISGDYRVIFKILDKNTIKLNDIGTHNQVY